MMEDRFPKPYQVPGDLYNRIFATQVSHSELLVDYALWNKIVASLPKDYQLPDLPVLSRTDCHVK
ncbi:hypothetical protein V3851_19135 [Paenibacillus sp. M1]|uniref:Uncharacterized protein n=1 Tax=Paenibacillus haidiansis TaxID=1574488 RepID=A0ABU7VYF6_9BACL